MNKSSNRFGYAATALLPLAWAAIAQAQDDADSVRIEEIVVTGEKIETALQETPASIAVVTGDTLEEKNLFDLQDVYLRVPNVASAGSGDRGFSIRGVNFTGVGFSGSGQTASVYIDDVVLNSRYAVWDGPLGAWDVEQIEVYRGPQSTNFGRNALIGAIVINTKDPTFDWEAAGRAIVAEDETRRLAGMVSGPLVDNELAFRIAAEKFDTDGASTNVTLDRDDWNFRDRLQTRAKLLWTPGALPGFTAMLTYMYADNERGSDNVRGPDYFDRISVYNAPSGEANESHTASLNLTYRINDEWHVKSVSAYLDNRYGRCEDSDGTADGPDVCDLYRDQTDDIFTQELRVHYDTERTQAVAGLYYYSGDEDENFGILEVVDILQPEDIENVAAFGEIRYDLSERWTLGAGFRYDVESAKRASSVVFNPAFGLPSSSNASDTDYSEFLPKATLTYRFTQDQSLSFTYQRAYRAGGSGNSIGGTPFEFDPEYTNNYEFAYRSVWNDGRLVFNANVFHIDWKDQQVQVALEMGTDIDFITANAAESELSGFEASMVWLPTNGLELFASYGYVDTEFDDYVNPVTMQSFGGNRFPFAPEDSYALGFSWAHPAGWLAAADFAYQASYFQQPSNDVPIDSHQVVNARFGYDARQWSAYVYGQNVLDEAYLLRQFGDEARVGDPRRIGLQLDVRF